MRIFAAVSVNGWQTRVGYRVVENGDFQYTVLSVAVFSEPVEVKPKSLYGFPLSSKDGVELRQI